MPALASSIPNHIREARRYIGHREEAPNRSPFIDSINRRLQLPLGSPYCASFVAYILDKSGAVRPAIRTGYALAYARKSVATVIPSRYVLEKRYRVDWNYLAIWKRPGGGGHIGFVERWIDERHGTTIEANTSPSQAGSQWNGDGIYRRLRVIDPFSKFSLIYFVKIEYH